MSLVGANERYARGDYAEALKQALANAGSDPGTALLLASKCLVALKNFEGLTRILEIAKANGATLNQAIRTILFRCLDDGLYASLIALDAKTPSTHEFHPIALYHASCAYMMQGDSEKAAIGFDRFRQMMPRYFNILPFGTDDDFNVMFRQGTLVLSAGPTIDRVAVGQTLPPAQTEFEIIRATSEFSGPIIACCADASYVRFFIERWLVAVIPFGCSMHVHIVDDDHETLAMLEELAIAYSIADRLSISVSKDTFGTATSYACARFDVLPVILEKFRTPIIALDIDVATTNAFADLLPRATDADFACFETGRCEPASVHQASIMMFRPQEESTVFLRDLAAFCRPKLHQAVRLNWMIDQAALFSLLRAYAFTRPSFRYLQLDKVTGLPMGAFITGLVSDEEKHAIKRKKAGLVEAPESGVVELVWEP